MHTLGPDATNLLELLRGYCAAEAVGGVASPICPLAALDVADLLSEPLADGSLFSLRNLVVILEDIGHSSPYLAELFAGHFGTALALLAPTDGADIPHGPYSLNGSHPNAALDVVADFVANTATYSGAHSGSATTSLPVAFGWFRQSVWLCHSAALLGSLRRVGRAITDNRNRETLDFAEASARSLVHAAADRHDHALGRGPYRETLGFGSHYDNDAFTTVMRQGVFAYLDCLITHSEPALADALQIVYGRAVHGFGGLMEPDGGDFAAMES